MGVTLLAYVRTNYSMLKEADLKRIRELETEPGLSSVEYET